jgi:signal transduction protein with GAF and PtsI domain
MATTRQIGKGTNVVPSDEFVTGIIRFLDSPTEVLDFITGDDVEETIVISRGGTTTFIGPALTAGVRGLITLQGAPQSHLGILSREFGIPCVMSVSFTEGETTNRGETIPADGTRVQLVVSDAAVGRILIDEEV